MLTAKAIMELHFSYQSFDIIKSTLENTFKNNNNNISQLSMSFTIHQKENTEKLSELCLKYNITSLSYLYLIGCKLNCIDMKYISRIIEINNNIISIHLSHNEIKNSGIFFLSQSLMNKKYIKIINLSSNKIGNLGIHYLSKFLENNDSLIELLLDDNLIFNGGIRFLFTSLKKNTSLKYVNLFKNKFTDNGLLYISECLKKNKTLCNLTLLNNRFGDIGMKSLSDSLIINKSLQYLEIGCNMFGKEGLDYLFESLKENNSIRSLYMHLINFHKEEGFEDMKKFSELLSTNKTIQNIEFTYCKINYIEISKSLMVNNTLKSIVFLRTQIDDSSVELLCNSLKYNNSIIHINLSDNYIGDRGAKSISDLLKVNNTIEIFSIENNSITNQGYNYIYEALKMNWTLRSISNLLHNYVKIEDELYINCSKSKQHEMIIKKMKNYILYNQVKWKENNHNFFYDTIKMKIFYTLIFVNINIKNKHIIYNIFSFLTLLSSLL